MNQQKESKQTEKRGEAFAPRSFVMMQEISTKAPCEVALMGERHLRIAISDFVTRAFTARRQHSFAREMVCFR